MPIDALSVLCAQLTRDLLAIAKFLSYQCSIASIGLGRTVWPQLNLVIYKHADRPQHVAFVKKLVPFAIIAVCHLLLDLLFHLRLHGV